MASDISVILPVYNAGEYLASAIESILNQTCTDFEFIIINDGSTDNSLECIQHYATIDKRIVVITRENKGLIFTLNEGIRFSSGGYIVRMDQDDISIEHRLEVQHRYMLKQDLDVCGGNYYVIDEQGERERSHLLFQHNDDIFLCMASNVPFPHPSVMMKKSFLENNVISYGMNGYRRAEDLDLWLNMFNVGAKFGNVGEYILEYRVLSTSMSRVNHKKIMREADRQFDKFMKDHISEFEKVFHNFFLKKKHGKELQQVTVKAVLRYSLMKKSLKMLYLCFKNVTPYNFLISTLSFLKLKISKY